MTNSISNTEVECRRRQRESGVLPEDKRAYSVREYGQLYGPGRSLTYDLIKQGKLNSVMIGGRRLILRDSAEALLSGEAA